MEFTYEELQENKKFMEEHPEQYIWWEEDIVEIYLALKDEEAMAERRRRYQEYPEARKQLEFDLKYWLRETKHIHSAKDVVYAFYNACKYKTPLVTAKATKNNEEKFYF